tara:strand:- start:1252 stop:1467 length:216 start_codon:yes stop_codon:yes gene_type:complete
MHQKELAHMVSGFCGLSHCHPVRSAARSGALQTRNLIAGNCMFRVPDQPCIIVMLHSIRDDSAPDDAKSEN